MTNMRRRTKKRAKQEMEYKDVLKVMDCSLIKDCFYCFFCGEIIKGKPDHHHLNGKENERLIDPVYLVHAHRTCHMMYHNNPVNKIPWFSQFLERLKGIDDELYYRETFKLNK